MFNEILAGKTSDDATSAAEASFLTPPVGERRTCTQCSRRFVSKPDSAQTVCSLCFVTNLEHAQKQHQSREAAAWRRAQRGDFVRMVVGLGFALVVTIVALAVFGLAIGLSVAMVAMVASLPFILRR